MQTNPHHGTSASVPARAGRDDDPWAMYYVVRSDRSLSFAQAMALGGAGAVTCADRSRRSDRWAANFAAWQALPYPKIALRANTERFEGLVALDGALIASVPARSSCSGVERAAGGEAPSVRAWLTLTTPVCGLSSSASLTVHHPLPVIHRCDQRGSPYEREHRHRAAAPGHHETRQPPLSYLGRLDD
jgi:hypothetical protein